ncbi:hypothetical protein [Nonomuraea sp. NPDC049141]|uniref:hypothetical protein n=1 Tax=Nonomuraea sp. NPDC049141 TaxID=3155500 RepID=UPI0033C57CA1
MNMLENMQTASPAATGDAMVDAWLAAGAEGTSACLVTPTPLNDFRLWLIATLAGVPVEAFRAGTLTDGQWRQVTDVMAESAGLPLSLAETHTMSSGALEELGVRVVFVQEGAMLSAAELTALASAGVRVVA